MDRCSYENAIEDLDPEIEKGGVDCGGEEGALMGDVCIGAGGVNANTQSV